MNAITATSDERAGRAEPLGSVGMWIFLATEVLFFGALLTGFVVYRSTYIESFTAASHELDFVLGAINTAVLLTSSFCMALAVLAARAGRTAHALTALLATAALGVAFLAIKGVEYAKEIDKGLAPWLADAHFMLESGTPAHVELFFNFYFSMTGLHALHLAIGIVLVLAITLVTARRGASNAEASIEVTGLYWHFVDVVWVFLYPMLYLIGR